jgi:formate dehydrogenase assembly factor FdhD
MTMAKLVKAVGTPRDLAMLAIGWLAREGKIVISDNGRTRQVSLQESS